MAGVVQLAKASAAAVALARPIIGLPRALISEVGRRARATLHHASAKPREAGPGHLETRLMESFGEEGYRNAYDFQS